MADLARSGGAPERTRHDGQDACEARARVGSRTRVRTRTCLYLEPGEVRLKTNHCHIVSFQLREIDAACLESRDRDGGFSR